MPAKMGLRQFAWPGDFAGDSPWARALLPTAILAATFLAYVVTLALGFVVDDPVLILTNEAIRSWRFFPSYFTLPIWSFHYPRQMWNAYRPTLMIWLRLNYGLFGLHAWGWHLSSLAVHVAATYLVYRLALRLTRDTWSAAAGALVFGLHPVHAETIAEVSWADQPLSTLFVLASVLTWWRSREGERQAAWLAASLAMCGAALLSKESSIMLPVLIGGCAWIYEGSCPRFLARGRSALVASFPYWIVVCLYVLWRVAVLKGFARMVTPLPFSEEIFTLPSVLVFYLRILVWPSGLSCYYDTPYVSSPTWRDYVVPAVLLAGVAGALVYWHRWTRRREPAQAHTIALGGLWTLLTLLPVLDFRFLAQGEIAHDRYLYLPSVGFALLVAIALRQAVGVLPRSFHRPAWPLGAALVFSGVMGIATARQCLFWSDDLVLSVRAHAIAPHNVSATTSLAAALAARGMEGKAMTLYQQALSRQPDYWVANRNLAYLYYNQGNYPEAARLLVKSLQVGPDEGDQFFYLGMALLRMGRRSEAEKSIRAALMLRPQGKKYHLGLGVVLKEEGKLLEARQEIETELAADPHNSQAQALLREVEEQMPATPEKPRSNQSPQGVPKT